MHAFEEVQDRLIRKFTVVIPQICRGLWPLPWYSQQEEGFLQSLQFSINVPVAVLHQCIPIILHLGAGQAGYVMACAEWMLACLWALCMLRDAVHGLCRSLSGTMSGAGAGHVSGVRTGSDECAQCGRVPKGGRAVSTGEGGVDLEERRPQGPSSASERNWVGRGGAVKHP